MLTNASLENLLLIKDGFRPDVGRYVFATVHLESGSVLSLFASVSHLITGSSLVFTNLSDGVNYPDSQIVMWRYATDEEVGDYVD